MPHGGHLTLGSATLAGGEPGVGQETIRSYIFRTCTTDVDIVVRPRLFRVRGGRPTFRTHAKGVLRTSREIILRV